MNNENYIKDYLKKFTVEIDGEFQTVLELSACAYTLSKNIVGSLWNYEHFAPTREARSIHVVYPMHNDFTQVVFTATSKEHLEKMFTDFYSKIPAPMDKHRGGTEMEPVVTHERREMPKWDAGYKLVEEEIRYGSRNKQKAMQMKLALTEEVSS